VKENQIQTTLEVSGMTCMSCEMRIENNLRKLSGIAEVSADYTRSRVAVTYNPNLVSMDTIIAAVRELNYRVKRDSQVNSAGQSGIHGSDNNDKMPINQLVGIAIILFALYIIIKNTVGFNFIPLVNPNMGYGILFVVGVINLRCTVLPCAEELTCPSVPPLKLDSTSKLSKLRPSLLYNTGRILSYTLIGGIVGALGSVISFSGAARGSIAILSGVFMVIMGLNMLNMFPWLRRLNPKMPRIFGNRIYNNKGKHGPFYVGLLNGLMPCGPLQAMQIYALGAGSFIAGAFSMFMFSLGTVPLMFGLGAISSVLTGEIESPDGKSKCCFGIDIRGYYGEQRFEPFRYCLCLCLFPFRQ